MAMVTLSQPRRDSACTRSRRWSLNQKPPDVTIASEQIQVQLTYINPSTLPLTFTDLFGGPSLHWELERVCVIIPYYNEFNGPVMASMKIKTVQTILLSAL
jgi:hypothetical protein